MDFHGLARRQLQALCKLNKIPANMTNLAMADALSALDSVEGVDEIMQQQSPEKTEGGTAKEPETVSRTSTRARRPPVKVLESGGTVSKTTTRTARKLVDGESYEDERNDMAETPAVASSRKRAPAAASSRKPEAPTLQKVYSTRRSVRLVEKQLSELCLEDRTKRTQPIKIDNELSSEMTESDVKGDVIKQGKSERNAEILDNDEVNSSEVSAHHLVEGNKVSNVDMTDDITPEEVEKAMPDACVAEAAGATGNPEKNSNIVSDSVCNLEIQDAVDKGETEKFVKEGLEVSEVAMDLSSDSEAAGEMGNPEKNSNSVSDGVGVCNLEIEDVVDKGDAEKFVKEALEVSEVAMDLSSESEAAGARTDNPQKNLNIVSDVVSNLENEDVVDKGETEKFVKEALEVSEVAMDLSRACENVVSCDGNFDLITKVEFITETSVGSVNVEEGVNDAVKLETEADKHDSNVPEATVEDNSDNLEQTAELGFTVMESGILSAAVGVIAEENDTAVQVEEDGNKENTASTLVREECFNAPKTLFEDKSLRVLKKMVKQQMEEMKISTTGENFKEGHAAKEIFKHERTPRPVQALRPLPDNTET